MTAPHPPLSRKQRARQEPKPYRPEDYDSREPIEAIE